MTTFTNPTIISILEHYKTIRALGYMDGLACRDEETYMPDAAAPLRGEAHGYLSVLIKKLMLDQTFVAMVHEARDADLTVHERAVVNALSREIQQYISLPDRRLQQRSEAKTNATSARKKARETDTFSFFAPHLEHLITLIREKAELIGYAAHPYDALIDDYER